MVKMGQGYPQAAGTWAAHRGSEDGRTYIKDRKSRLSPAAAACATITKVA